MDIDIDMFHWQVPVDGFKWVQERHSRQKGLIPQDMTTQKEWMLTDGVAIGQRYERRNYAPLIQFPALYRAFADLPIQDRDAILSFANQYGGLGEKRVMDTKAPDDPKRFLMLSGEPLSTWTYEIFRIKRAIDIWDMVERRDGTALGRFIKWDDPEPMDGRPVRKIGGWSYDSQPDRPRGQGVTFAEAMDPVVGRSMEVIAPVLDLFKPGDILMPASFLVQRWINQQINKTVSPMLLYQLELGKRVVQIVPQTLLSAMWLQFARAIEGNKKYRTCKECGKWLEVSGEDGGIRKNRLFCSDPCKSRDHRRRKEQAIQMQREGKDAAAIAKELGMELKTIRTWIKRTK